MASLLQLSAALPAPTAGRSSQGRRLRLRPRGGGGGGGLGGGGSGVGGANFCLFQRRGAAVVHGRGRGLGPLIECLYLKYLLSSST